MWASKRPPVRTSGADGLPDSDRTPAALSLFEDQHQKQLTLPDGSSSALRKLNEALLNALREERARSHALLRRLEQLDAETDARAPPSIARASSAQAASLRSSSAVEADVKSQMKRWREEN